MLTAIDPELERHRRTWIGFTWFLKIALIVVVLVLAGMAIFLV
ncbi:MAG: aa3-type cytochrome c oxidase subunit IV [Alphaproteobacteria bacterium]|nr:aa3-type cytochrome c oxidase subunit IV [Alphaproteobacteria bacterium]